MAGIQFPSLRGGPTAPQGGGGGGIGVQFPSLRGEGQPQAAPEAPSAPQARRRGVFETMGGRGSFLGGLGRSLGEGFANIFKTAEMGGRAVGSAIGGAIGGQVSSLRGSEGGYQMSGTPNSTPAMASPAAQDRAIRAERVGRDIGGNLGAGIGAYAPYGPFAGGVFAFDVTRQTPQVYTAARRRAEETGDTSGAAILNQVNELGKEGLVELGVPKAAVERADNFTDGRLGRLFFALNVGLGALGLRELKTRVQNGKLKALKEIKERADRLAEATPEPDLVPQGEAVKPPAEIFHGTSVDPIKILNEGFVMKDIKPFGRAAFFTDSISQRVRYGDNYVALKPERFNLKEFPTLAEERAFIKQMESKDIAEAIRKEGKYDGFIIPNPDRNVGATYGITNNVKLNQILREQIDQAPPLPGTEVTRPRVAREPEPLEGKIEMTSEPKTEADLIKAEAEADILTALQTAEAGKRFVIKDAEGYAEGTIGQSSTFPEWIPPDLRRKPLLDAVVEHIFEGTTPAKRGEIELYNVVRRRLEGEVKDRLEFAATGKVQAFKGIISKLPVKDGSAALKVASQAAIGRRLAAMLDVVIRRGRFRTVAAGIYKMGKGIIRVKQGGLPVITHEVGHFLQDTIPAFKNKVVARFAKEFDRVSDSYGGYGVGELDEGFAQFVRAYVTEPAKAREMAPEATKYFGEVLNDMPTVREAIEQAQEGFRLWLEAPAEARIRAQISTEAAKQGVIDSLRNTWRNLYSQFFDAKNPLLRLEKLTGEKKIPVEDSPYIRARLHAGWYGKPDVFLTRGTFGAKYWKTEGGKTVPNFTGKSLQAILAPLDHSGNLDAFRTYLVARRAIELGERNKQTGIRIEDAQAVVKRMDERYPNFREKAKELQGYNDALLTYAKEHGILSDETIKEIKSANAEYTPFYRVMEELDRSGFSGTSMAKVRAPIKRLRGSELEIIDPLESIVKNTYAIIQAAENNSIRLSAVNLASKYGNLARLIEEVPAATHGTKVKVEEVVRGLDVGNLPAETLEKVVDIFRPSAFNEQNILQVMVDGKPKYYEVDPAIYKTLMGMDGEQTALLMKVLAQPARMLRAGATLAPEFISRNPLRDQFSAFIYSKYGFLPLYNAVRGLFELARPSKVNYDLFKMSGAEHAMLVSMDRSYLQQKLKDIVAKQMSIKTLYRAPLNIIKSPLEALRVLSEFGEKMTRMGEFQKALKAGASPMEAAMAAREVTLDFARMGSKLKQLNQIVAFLNANLQGTDKMVRAFKERPVQTSLKVAAAITVPSILLYLHNRDDARWEEIPLWQKDLFWIVMSGHVTKEEWAAMSPGQRASFAKENPIYRIPKPFEIGILFGSVPERTMEYIEKHDPYAFKQLRKSVTQGFVPDVLPTGIEPIMENITNYSFFTERPIIPQSLQDFPPEYQAAESTAEWAKFLGEKVGYSPSKIENLYRGYTGGLGQYLTDALDKAMVGTGLRPEKIEPARTLSQTVVAKAFVVRSPLGSGSESVNRVYDLLEEISGKEQYAKKLREEKRLDEYRQYKSEHPELLLGYDMERKTYYSLTARLLRDAVDQMAQFRKQQSKLYAAKDISPEEKRRRLDELDAKISDQATKILNRLRKKNVLK